MIELRPPRLRFRGIPWSAEAFQARSIARGVELTAADVSPLVRLARRHGALRSEPGLARLPFRTGE